jgi:hypothetical protein
MIALGIIGVCAAVALFCLSMYLLNKADDGR